MQKPDLRPLSTKPLLLWPSLLVLSVLTGYLLNRLDFPAAFFVAAVVCGVGFSLAGLRITVKRPGFVCAQALVGCAVAKSMTPDIWAALASNGVVLVGMVLSSIVAGGLVGWFLTKWRILPGSTAAWGSSPGGASAMVAMAESFGADARLVALMQYLRVLIVVLTASLVAHTISSPTIATPPAASVSSFFALFGGQPLHIALTLTITASCALIAHRLRIPAGPLLITMVVGMALNSAGLFEFRLPYVFQIAASLLLGWFVGLGFNRELLVSAWRTIHWLILSALLLIAICGLFAWALHRFAACDPLTAYLATTPGGLDSVILLAMGSQTDVPFVVAAQTLRLFLVSLTGPIVARFICRMA